MKVEVITHDKHIIDSVIFHIFFLAFDDAYATSYEIGDDCWDGP